MSTAHPPYRIPPRIPIAGHLMFSASKCTWFFWACSKTYHNTVTHSHIYIYILYIILLSMAEFRQLTNLKSDLFPSEIKPFGDDFHYQPKSTAKWHHCQAVMIQPKWMCAKYWESNLRGMPLIAILEIVNSYSAAQWLHMCIRDEIFQLHSSKDHNNIWLIINH